MYTRVKVYINDFKEGRKLLARDYGEEISNKVDEDGVKFFTFVFSRKGTILSALIIDKKDEIHVFSKNPKAKFMAWLCSIYEYRIRFNTSIWYKINPLELKWLKFISNNFEGLKIEEKICGNDTFVSIVENNFHSKNLIFQTYLIVSKFTKSVFDLKKITRELYTDFKAEDILKNQFFIYRKVSSRNTSFVFSIDEDVQMVVRRIFLFRSGENEFYDERVKFYKENGYKIKTYSESKKELEDRTFRNTVSSSFLDNTIIPYSSSYFLYESKTFRFSMKQDKLDWAWVRYVVDFAMKVGRERENQDIFFINKNLEYQCLNDLIFPFPKNYISAITKELKLIDCEEFIKSKMADKVCSKVYFKELLKRRTIYNGIVNELSYLAYHCSKEYAEKLLDKIESYDTLKFDNLRGICHVLTDLNRYHKNKFFTVRVIKNIINLDFHTLEILLNLMNEFPEKVRERKEIRNLCCNTMKLKENNIDYFMNHLSTTIRDILLSSKKIKENIVSEYIKSVESLYNRKFLNRQEFVRIVSSVLINKSNMNLKINTAKNNFLLSYMDENGHQELLTKEDDFYLILEDEFYTKLFDRIYRLSKTNLRNQYWTKITDIFYNINTNYNYHEYFYPLDDLLHSKFIPVELAFQIVETDDCVEISNRVNSIVADIHSVKKIDTKTMISKLKKELLQKGATIENLIDMLSDFELKFSYEILSAYNLKEEDKYLFENYLSRARVYAPKIKLHQLFTQFGKHTIDIIMGNYKGLFEPKEYKLNNIKLSSLVRDLLGTKEKKGLLSNPKSFYTQLCSICNINDILDGQMDSVQLQKVIALIKNRGVDIPKEILKENLFLGRIEPKCSPEYITAGDASVCCMSFSSDKAREYALEKGFGIFNVYYKNKVIANSVLWINKDLNCLVIDNIEVNKNYTKYNESISQVYKNMIKDTLKLYKLKFAVQGDCYNDLYLYNKFEKNIIQLTSNALEVKTTNFYTDADNACIVATPDRISITEMYDYIVNYMQNKNNINHKQEFSLSEENNLLYA